MRGGRENVALLEQLPRSTPAGEDGHDANVSYLRHTMMDALVTEKRFQKLLSSFRFSEYPGSASPPAHRRVLPPSRTVLIRLSGR